MKKLSPLCAVALLLLALSWPYWAASQGGPPESTFYLENPKADSRLSEIKFVDAVDDSLSLDNFRGGVVLLNIWATWCAPCREELPALDRLQVKLESYDFHIVALSIDNASASEIEAFYDNYGIKNLQVYIDETGRTLYSIKSYGIPTTLLLDQQGREIGRVVGPVEWDKPEVIDVIKQHIASEP